jgi:hypothetical protein
MVDCSLPDGATFIPELYQLARMMSLGAGEKVRGF